MLENDLTNIEMLIMKCIWDTPEGLVTIGSNGE